MSRQYQKKSSSSKKRGKKGHGPSRSTVGGGQTTGLFVTAAIAIIAWNFAR